MYKKRRNNKGKPKGKFSSKRDYETKGQGPDKIEDPKPNDPIWYTTDEDAVYNVSNFSFNTPTGSQFNVRANQNNIKLWEKGIIAIKTAPAIGISRDVTSPINIAGQRIYTYVRHANSGHSNYDPADLIKYLLAMDGAYTFWSWCTRLYGIATQYSKVNKYVGDALLRAAGLQSPVEFRRNINQFRSWLNMYALRLSQLAVPKVMPLFDKHTWMYSGVYQDEPTAKSQFYMYVPACVFKYDDTALSLAPLWVTMTPNDTEESHTLADTVVAVSTIQNIGEAIITGLMNSEDVGIISGDILKAYGPEYLWNLGAITEDYVCPILYSQEILDQIHNTSFTGVSLANTADGELCVSVNTASGALLYDPHFKSTGDTCCDKFLDFDRDNITHQDIMTASRNMLISEYDSGNAWWQLGSCGSEICICANLIGYTEGSGGYGSTLLTSRIFGNMTSGADVQSDASYVRNFNRAPIAYNIRYTGSDMALFAMGDLGNFCLVKSEDLERLNYVATMSLFGLKSGAISK